VLQALADDFRHESLGKQHTGANPVSPPKPQALPIVIHACDFDSGRSAKVEKHLSAPLGVKNRFAQ
jgi:hypothetical protein